MRKNLFFIFLLCVVCFFIGCASEPAPAPVKEKPVEEQIAFIQVTDKAQISYAELPCSIYFADGRIEKRKTNVEGKIKLKANPDMIIYKVIYDFTKYKRKEGRFLAKEDFPFRRKVKTKRNSLKQEFILNFSAKKGARTILILDLF